MALSNLIRQQILSRLLDHALDAALMMDEHCRIQFANGALAQLSGWEIAELEGESLNILLPEPLTYQHDGLVQNYYHHPEQSQVLGRPREMMLRHRDGQLIPVELKAVDLGLQDGTRYLGGFMIDLRHRKALESQNAALLASLKHQALTDALTGLPNRRAFEIETLRTLTQALREKQATCLALFDLDRFKSINDRYGHLAGDAVLRQTAQAAQAAMRAGDLFGRVGGEEFALLLPHTNSTQAVPAVQRVREAIGAAETLLDTGQPVRITASAGLTRLDAAPPLGLSLAMAWQRADTALYQAKGGGRNRLTVI